MAHLLLLPAELRELIYQYVVVSTETLDLVHQTIGSSRRPSILVSQPALSKVSRQLRNEVLPIFYSQNTFQLRCSLSFKARYALEGLTPRDRPGWILRETANEVHLIQTMQYGFNIMQNLATARRWLRMIGKENQKALGRLVLCCLRAEGEMLKEMASLRFDYKGLQVTASDQPILEEGWEWLGETDIDGVCRYMGDWVPERTHYLMRFEG